MADTLKRLVGPKQLANSATTEYTVPSATTTVIRMIHLSNPTAADKTVTISIGADAAGTRILDAYTVPAGTVFGYPCNFTMATTEILQMSASAATSVVAVVNGIEVT
jgi:hypothetical protein